MQDRKLEHYSGYSEEEVLPVCKLMISYLHGPVRHDAFFRKYAGKRYMKGRFNLAPNGSLLSC
jgi:G2/mitotic-specific cyclin 2